MSITRVAQDIKSGNGSTYDHSKASAALNVPAGALIVVKFSSPQSGNVTTAPADTALNDFLPGPTNSGSNEQALWYCLSAKANAANVVTSAFSGGCSEYGYSVEVYTGGTWTYDSANSGVKAGLYTTSPTVSPSLSTSGAGIIATCFGQYDYPRAGNSATQSPGSVVNSSIDTPTGTTCVMASGDVINSSAFSGTISVNIQQPTPANTKCDLLYASFLSSGGGGAISGSANLSLAATATIAGAGALAGAASLAVAAGAILKGAGALIGAAALAFAATSTPTGAGALSGNAGMALSATATPSASGVLAGNASLTITATGIATGPSGSISGSAPLAINATGTLAGTGAIAGSAGLAFAPSGTLGASGALAGTAPFTITAIARPNGSSALAGSASLAFTATGKLQGLAPIAGSANLAFTSTGALTGTGLLAGQGNIAFISQGTPSASAAVAGNASMVFTATGTLTNGLPSLPADPLYYVALPARPFYATLPARSFYAALPSRSFYILSNPNMTSTFSNLDPRETEVLTFDATNDLASGETLTNIENVAITVQSGPPTSTLPTLTGQIINGSPVTLTVNGKPITIATGCCVQVVGSGGVTNCSYLIAITCATSNPDKVLVLKGILPVNAQ